MFSLPQSLGELKSAPGGKTNYMQVTPHRSVTGESAISNGPVDFEWTMGANEWWSPEKTHFRLRYTLTDGAGAQLTNAANIGVGTDIGNALWQSASLHIGSHEVERVSSFYQQVSTLKKRVNRSHNQLQLTAAQVEQCNFEFADQQSTVTSDAVTPLSGASQEVAFQPPLSVFDRNKALPAGKYMIRFQPSVLATLRKQVIESTGADKTYGAAGDYLFSIDSLYLYVGKLEGPRVDSMEYFIDSQIVSCTSEGNLQNNFGSRQFTVAPSTDAVIVAFQDSRVNSNTLHSSAKFLGDGAEPLQQSNALTRFFVQYGDQRKPMVDADPNYDASVRNMAQRYLESALDAGTYWREGSPGDSMSEWLSRGAYHYLAFDKPADDRSTNVTVYTQFDGAADLANIYMLVFSVSKSISKVSIQNGSVARVETQLV
jgi:predicted Zn-ribbon and HTH transcriptional regulator